MKTMKKILIDSLSDATNHTNSTTRASRKRNPETPVKNEGSISAWLTATHRKRSAEATSTVSTKSALTSRGTPTPSDSGAVSIKHSHRRHRLITSTTLR